MLRTPLACTLTLTLAIVATASAQNWPSFRGPDASGIGADGTPPITWDTATGRNVAWSTPIPGLGHSSPIVWGDRVFVTSAVTLPGPAAAGRAPTGADDDVALHEQRLVASSAPQAWRLYCLDRRTGRILWERTAHEGVPKVKRHAKASQASATPATDGVHVVAMMGSEGLYAYTMDGELLWAKDLGRLDVGFVDDHDVEWGPASSPVIDDGRVIVQNDRHADSYVAAFDVETGREAWRVARDEMPAWSTPLVHRGTRAVLVTSSPRYIRGYDSTSGHERWRIADDTQVKVPTPIVAGNLVIVTGGYPTGARPIMAIEAETGKIAWRLERGSPYTTTPLVYDGILYVCVDNGVLAAYDVRTGKRYYQRRIAPGANGFSASPVAAAGRIYFTSEDGPIYVVRAGAAFELLATNDMKALCLATPAISGELLLVRTRTQLIALRD
jgi:outer membrane protein assembly factor BamB